MLSHMPRGVDVVVVMVGQSNSIIYYVGRMLTHADKQMKEYVKLQVDGIKCRRKWLLSHFDIENSKKTLPSEIKHMS